MLEISVQIFTQPTINVFNYCLYDLRRVIDIDESPVPGSLYESRSTNKKCFQWKVTKVLISWLPRIITKFSK